MRVIVIGTLGGVLALTQTRQIIAQLREQWPEAEFRVRAVSAREEYPSKPGMPILEQALLAGEVDIAVHTLDKFTPLPNLKIASTLKRLDPRDVLVGREGLRKLGDLPVGALLGASGAGRRAQLLAERPDLGIREVGGDTEQQLISFGRGELSGLVLAACGLLRLDLRNRIQAFIEPDALLPPPGQGALSLVVREGDEVADELAYGLHHNLTALRTAAERAFAARLGAGPLDPVGALAQIESDSSLRLEGLLATHDGSTLLRGEISGKPGEAEELGYELAEDILQQGGLAIMTRP